MYSLEEGKGVSCTELPIIQILLQDPATDKSCRKNLFKFPIVKILLQDPAADKH